MQLPHPLRWGLLESRLVRKDRGSPVTITIPALVPLPCTCDPPASFPFSPLFSLPCSPCRCVPPPLSPSFPPVLPPLPLLPSLPCCRQRPASAHQYSSLQPSPPARPHAMDGTGWCSKSALSGILTTPGAWARTHRHTSSKQFRILHKRAAPFR